MKRILAIIALVVWALGRCYGADTLYVSCSQTVHLQFPMALRYVDLGNRVLVAKVVEGSKDFLAVKAREPFDFCTSISALETGGKMHTMVVAYKEKPSKLFWKFEDKPAVDSARASVVSTGETLSGTGIGAGAGQKAVFSSILREPKRLYHLGTKDYGIRVEIDDIQIRKDVLYLVLAIHNNSGMSYEFAMPRFTIESRRRGRRGLDFEKSPFPKAYSGVGPVGPGESRRMVFSFDKFTPVRGQVFKVYLYEDGGGSRNFKVVAGWKDF